MVQLGTIEGDGDGSRNLGHRVSVNSKDKILFEFFGGTKV